MDALFHCDFCGKIAMKSSREYNRNIKNNRGNFCCARCAGLYGVLRKRRKKQRHIKNPYPFAVGKEITNNRDIVKIMFYDEDKWLHGILINKGWEIVIKPAVLLDWRLVNKSKNSNLRV